MVQEKGSRTKNDVLVGWVPPRENFVKFNTDGALNPTLGTACTGGLLHDHFGRWVGGFHRNIISKLELDGGSLGFARWASSREDRKCEEAKN